MIQEKPNASDEKTYWICGVAGCSYTFPDDSSIESRKTSHNTWHTNARKDKRNTIQGKPNWKLCR